MPSIDPKYGSRIVKRVHRSLRADKTLKALGFEFLPKDKSLVVRETKGMQVFWVAKGGYVQESHARQDLFEAPRDLVGFHVSEFEEKVIEDPEGTADLYYDLAYQKIKNELLLRCLLTLSAAKPSADEWPKGNPSLLVDEVIDEVPEDLGSEVIGIGRHKAWSLLPEIEGIEKISLRNFRGVAGEDQFPADRVFLLSPTAGRFVVWNKPYRKSYAESDNWFYHVLGRWEVGLMLHHPERVRRLNV